MSQQQETNQPDRQAVLIRKDISRAQQAVQAGHAVAEWLLHVHKNQSEWDNGTLVYLGVRDEDELAYWGEKLDRKNIRWTGFREPDIGNQLTAIACLSDGKVFSNLKLLGD